MFVQFSVRSRSLVRLLLVGLLCVLTSACATSGDPYEPLNRKIMQVNDVADRALLKPAATGYQKVVPQFAQSGVRNFFSNLGDVWVSVNQLLQGKPGLFVSDLGRFSINSTLGIGGLFDVATDMGLAKHDEDFGQTLGVWGINSGPYIVVPFWGPSTFRDGIGDAVGTYAFAPAYLDDTSARNLSLALWLIQTRASYLDAERLVQGDRYLFIRDAFLQRREYLINDGELDDPFLTDI